MIHDNLNEFMESNVELNTILKWNNTIYYNTDVTCNVTVKAGFPHALILDTFHD